MRKRKAIKVTIQPNDALRLAIQVSNQRLAEAVTVARRFKRLARAAKDADLAAVIRQFLGK